MEQLANRLNGTALIPVEVEQRAKSARKADRAAAGARRAKLESLSRSFEKGYELVRGSTSRSCRRTPSCARSSREASTMRRQRKRNPVRADAREDCPAPGNYLQREKE